MQLEWQTVEHALDVDAHLKRRLMVMPLYTIQDVYRIISTSILFGRKVVGKNFPLLSPMVARG